MCLRVNKGMAIRSEVAAVAWSWDSEVSRIFMADATLHGHAPINSLLGGATRRYSAFSAVGPLKMPFGLDSLGKKSC